MCDLRTIDRFCTKALVYRAQVPTRFYGRDRPDNTLSGARRQQQLRAPNTIWWNEANLIGRYHFKKRFQLHRALYVRYYTQCVIVRREATALLTSGSSLSLTLCPFAQSPKLKRLLAFIHSEIDR